MSVGIQAFVGGTKKIIYLYKIVPMHIRIVHIVSIAFALMSLPLLSQVTLGTQPVATRIGDNLIESLNFNALDDVNTEVLFAEDVLSQDVKSAPLRFAVKRNVNFNLSTSGRWTNLPNGDRIWMLGVYSPEALALGVTFDEFDIPKGATVHLYDPNGLEVIGALTHTNNKNTGILTTSRISGDNLIIEYYEPFAVRDQGRLSVRTIAHSYRPINHGVNLEEASCFVDMACLDESNSGDISSAITLITVDDGTRYATGVLLNNANYDGRPLLLTNAANLWGHPETWLFSFRFLNEECNEFNPNGKFRSIAGAEILEVNADASMVLLELSSRPQPGWGVYYAGWDRSGVTPQHVSTISHPFGMRQQYAMTEQAPGHTLWQGRATFSVPQWNQGTTERGSSGAPLIDEHGRVSGVFQGGTDRCNENGADYFSKMSVAWEDFRKHLNPFNQDLLFLDGTYLRFGEVDEDAFQSAVAMFPNPASSFVNFVNDSDEALLSIRIYDQSGRQVRDLPYTGQSVMVSDLNTGYYIVQIGLETRTVQRKLLVWR